jgi:hypothetical protein
MCRCDFFDIEVIKTMQVMIIIAIRRVAIICATIAVSGMTLVNVAEGHTQTDRLVTVMMVVILHNARSDNIYCQKDRN